MKHEPPPVSGSEFSIAVRVYYEDTDAGGIVYHANYLKFMERCRSDWLARRGCDVRRVREDFGVVFTVRRAALDFRVPARLCDMLEVTVSVAKLGKVTLDLEQSVRRGDEVLCSGTLRLASVEPGSLKPRAMPGRLVDLIDHPSL